MLLLLCHRYATVDRPEVERQPENASELASWYDELGFVAELRQVRRIVVHDNLTIGTLLRHTCISSVTPGRIPHLPYSPDTFQGL